jgi:putative transposase
VNRQQLNTRKLMFHSDQGVQYSAKIFRDKLVLLNITQSMSRKENCWDNAVMEWFFRSLKPKRLNNITFINHASVVDEVERYIRFYNYKRRHSNLGYMTPHQKYNKLKNVA